MCILSPLTTLLRASEWGEPLRFVLSEVAKHPLSPRATYDEGRTYVILCEYDSTSTFCPDGQAGSYVAHPGHTWTRTCCPSRRC